MIAALAAAALCACGGGKHNDNSKNSDGAKQPKYRQFSLPVAPPAAVPPEQQAEWLREHFWDGFEFADSAYVAAQDSSAIIGLFVLYTMQAAGAGDAAQLVDVMKRAEAAPHTFRYFVSMAEKVLHDPNSPYRDDELYIPVLETIIASPLLDEAEKAVPRHDLRMAMQNRLGTAANDFRFTDINGRNSSLYKTEAEWLLLFFSNPGCPLCAEITRELQESETVTQAVAQGRLKIISLYPDDDVEAWRQHAGDIPRQWTYAHDAKHEIRDRQLYDLKAIPALYLLDSQKHVIIKDAADISLVEMQLARTAKP